MVMWSARLRDPGLRLLDEVKFTSLTLVKNYNAPSTLVLTGRLRDLRILMQPGYGIVVRNGDGQQFSGFMTAAQRNGDGSGQVTFTGDLAKLWGRICYPSPGFAWDGQTLATDHVAGTVEARILSLVNRNAGPAAWFSTLTGTDPGQTNVFTQWKTVFTNNRDRLVQSFVENPDTHDIYVWQIVDSKTSAIIRCDTSGVEQDRMTLTGGGYGGVMYITTTLAKQTYLTFPYGAGALDSTTTGTWVKLLYTADSTATAAAAKTYKVDPPVPTKVSTTTTTSAGVAMRIGYGNMEGGYTLTEKNWDGRIAKQIALIRNMNIDVFACVEIHEQEDSSFGTAKSGITYFLNKLKAVDNDWALYVGDEGNHLYYRPSKWNPGSKTHYNMPGGRDITSFPLIDVNSGVKVRVFVTHFRANDDNGKSRDAERKDQSQYLADLVARTAGPLIVVGDFNTNSNGSAYIKAKLKKLGLTGVREHGAVKNGSKGTNKSGKQWIEDIYSRTVDSDANSELVLTNGASDHKGWLRSDVTFSGTKGSKVTVTSTTKLVSKPPPPRRAWCVGETMYDGYIYRLYGTPYNNTASTVSPAIPAFIEVIYDGQILRTVLCDFLGRGQDGKPYDALLVPCGLQFSMVGTQPCLIVGFRTGTSTAKLIGLHLYSLPLKPAARGVEDRRINGLRMPGDQGRGEVGTTDARFDVLGVLCAKLAETADLGMNIDHAYDISGSYLNFFLSDAPDMSDSIRVGPPEMGGPIQLGTDWTYTAAYPTVTTGLAGAGGLGSDRILRYNIDTDAEEAWDTRVETFIDMSGQTDESDIDDNINTTILAGSNPSTVSVTLGRSELRWGIDVPLGARILAVLDGETVIDRVRQITTTVGGSAGQAREVTTAVMGSSDAPLKTPTQKALATMLRRLQNLERK